MVPDEELRKKLTPEQYHVTQEKGTEPPFSGKYLKTRETGMYECVVCGHELFSSLTKFDLPKEVWNSAWPSFYSPANRKNIELKKDISHGMMRTEVLCKNCGAHLGHLFDDGPKEKGGDHYCVNSCALNFKPQK